MGIHNKQGFTIIEVMLFLAISGALTVAVLVGAGASISQQRYRDSVNSLSNFLQQQYSEVTTVRNDRDMKWTCSGAAGVVAAPVGGDSRGATDCVVLGKYISLADKEVTIQTVVGRAGVPTGTDDVTALVNANTTLSDIDRQEYTIEWGASMRDINKAPTATTVLIVRSPTTGAIRTFINETGANRPLAETITTSFLRAGTHICVNPDGMFGGKPFDVEFVANASSSTGIRVNGDGTTPCEA